MPRQETLIIGDWSDGGRYISASEIADRLKLKRQDCVLVEKALSFTVAGINQKDFKKVLTPKDL